MARDNPVLNPLYLHFGGLTNVDQEKWDKIFKKEPDLPEPIPLTGDELKKDPIIPEPVDIGARRPVVTVSPIEAGWVMISRFYTTSKISLRLSMFLLELLYFINQNKKEAGMLGILSTTIKILDAICKATSLGGFLVGVLDPTTAGIIFGVSSTLAAIIRIWGDWADNKKIDGSFPDTSNPVTK